MIVAGLQTDIAWESPRENFRRVEAMTTWALDEHAQRPDLLVLPEMFATGFSMDSAKVAGHADETRDFLAGLARANELHVLGGYAEPADPLPANACSIFDATGKEILHFRKLHPFTLAGEDRNFVAGESLETVEVFGVRVTPLICYDLRFPEPFRAAAEKTDLYCVVANWPHKRIHAWSTLLRARAIENQAFVLGVNRAGKGDGLLYPGASALLDPLGEVAGRWRRFKGGETDEDTAPPGCVRGEVDPARVREVRTGLGFLRDRKPELYRKLEEEGR